MGSSSSRNRMTSRKDDVGMEGGRVPWFFLPPAIEGKEGEEGGREGREGALRFWHHIRFTTLSSSGRYVRRGGREKTTLQYHRSYLRFPFSPPLPPSSPPFTPLQQPNSFTAKQFPNILTCTMRDTRIQIDEGKANLRPSSPPQEADTDRWVSARVPFLPPSLPSLPSVPPPSNHVPAHKYASHPT